MLRFRAWQSTDTLIRAQLALFQALSDQIGLTEDDRRRLLDLDEGIWIAWVDFLASGKVPAEPPLPAFLRRVAECAFALSDTAEQIDQPLCLALACDESYPTPPSAR